MKDNWFEDKMNERFEDFDSELDLHAAWADLEERRQPKKRKKRTGIFWWIGSGLAVLFLGFGLVFNLVKTEQVPQTNTSNILVKKEANTKNEQTDNQCITGKVVKTNSIQKVSINDEDSNKKKSLEKEIKAPKKSTNITKENIVHDISKNLSLISIDAKKFLIKKPSIDATHLKVNYPPLILIETLEKDISPLANKIIHHTIECSFEESLRKLQIFGITFNYGKVFRGSPLGRNINSAYLQRRDEAETPLDAWSTQVFYQKNIKRNWFTRVNLGYSQTTDLFQDSYTNSTKVSMDDQILQINIYPDGSAEEIRGMAMINQEEISTGKFYQRYRQAFVGLEFGKEKYLQSNFKLRSSVGADFTIYHANSGNVYLDDNSSFGVYQDLSEISDTKGGIITAKLRLEIGKNFGYNNEISFGIVGKTNLKILENDLGRRQYLLSSLSYRKSF